MPGPLSLLWLETGFANERSHCQDHPPILQLNRPSRIDEPNDRLQHHQYTLSAEFPYVWLTRSVREVQSIGYLEGERERPRSPDEDSWVVIKVPFTTHEELGLSWGSRHPI